MYSIDIVLLDALFLNVTVCSYISEKSFPRFIEIDISRPLTRFTGPFRNILNKKVKEIVFESL